MQGVNLAEQVKTKLEELVNQKPKIKLEAVLLAVSGGRDSMALLHLMLETGVPFSVAHLDHGIREDSSLDGEFVREVCLKLEKRFFSERVNIPEIAKKRGWSLEEAARKIRYEFLNRTAKQTNSSAILTAHHLQDNAETVLMQVLRGTARATGIPARRGLILRPLLEISKHELEQFMLERGLTWREDSSNSDPTYTRNWVRLEVMPKLLTRYPKAAESLARYGMLARDEDVFLEELTAKIPTWAKLALEPKVLQRRQIRRQLESAGLNVDFEHLEEIRGNFENPAVTRVSLSKDHVGVIQNGKLEILGIDSKFPAEFDVQDFDFSSFPNAIQRTRAAGDKIQLSGGTRKLSDVLIDKKIPRETRDSIQLIAQGSEVLYVGLEPPILNVRIGVTRDLEIDAMKHALELAREAFEAGEVPVGAVILHRGEVVGIGRNQSLKLSDMTRHAELEAIRNASQKLETPYLTECTLVVTLEPCLMCLGAILEARLKRVVFGASSSKNGALGGVMDATRANWSHQIEVRTGVLEKQSSALLSRFFAETRASKKV
jgi:tRNA(Ile)-lysidine synthase